MHRIANHTDYPGFEEFGWGLWVEDKQGNPLYRVNWLHEHVDAFQETTQETDINQPNTDFSCPSCGAKNWGHFVQYGSYFLQCLTCGESGPITSFIAIGPKLTSVYQAIEVNGDLSEKKFIIEGNGPEIYAVVKHEAIQGKLIWLKPIVSSQSPT